MVITINRLICTKCGLKFSENKGKWKQKKGFPSLFFFWYCTKCYNIEHKEAVERDKPRIKFLKARAAKEGLSVNEYYWKHRKELLAQKKANRDK